VPHVRVKVAQIEVNLSVIYTQTPSV